MSQGDKPTLSIDAKPKADKTAKFTKLMSGWPNDFGGWNLKLAKGASITLADGEVITDAEFYISGKDWSKPQQSRGGASPRPEVSTPASDDDIPF